ncbi:MAG TPA: CcoQ/FixQ family Cbb3-type cytochrome c oxidase assembly chaperone [Acetobacteraceae bacterium]|jgi:cbb3-type cytochrome oxidase subunit 3
MTMMPVIQWLQHLWIVPVLLVFVLILLGTYWPGRRSEIERKGRIPLDLDDDREGASRRAD